MPLTDKEVAMAGRLQLFRKTLNIKQKKVADGSGSTQGHLSEMERGVKQIQARVIFYLSEKYRLNAHWLFTGEGNMTVSEDFATLKNEPETTDTKFLLAELESRVSRLEDLEKWKEGTE